MCLLGCPFSSMGLGETNSLLGIFFLFVFDFENNDTLREHLVPAEPKAFAGVGTGSQLRF